MTGVAKDRVPQNHGDQPIDHVHRGQSISRIGSWCFDIPNQRLSWSEQMSRMLGLPGSTAPNWRDFLSAIHADDRANVAAAWADMRLGVPYDIEHRIVVNGGISWLRQRAEVSCGPHGAPLFAYGTAQDITQVKAAESALRESEANLRRAQRAAQIGVYAYDFSADRWTSSEELDRIFGIGPDFPRTADGWLSLVHPDDRDMMATHLAAVADRRVQGFNHDYRAFRADDHREIWVHGAGEIEIDAEGFARRMIGTIQDVTQRKKDELALDEAIQQNRRLFISNPLPMWVADVATQSFIDVNDAALTQYGYSRQEFLELAVGDLMLDAETDGNAPLADGAGRVGKGEINRQVCRNGKVIEVANWSGQVPYGGGPAQLTICQDVTMQRELEHVKAQQVSLAERLNRIATTVPGAIYACTLRPDGTFLLPFIDGRLAAALGVAPADMSHGVAAWLELIHPEDMTVIRHDIEISARALTPWHGLFRVLPPGGGLRWIEGNSTPRAEQDGSVTWYGYVYDVTDRVAATDALKESRDQMQALAARLELVREEERTRIARELHDELGQTLTAIRLHTRRIRTATRDAVLSAQLTGVDRMLDAATQTARRIARELRPQILDTLDLGGAIEWEVGEFRKRHGIRCQCEIPSRDIVLPEDVKTHVYRIFQEALTNVSRHAEATRVTVRLAVDSDNLRLTVTDNGRGIPRGALIGKTLGLAGMSERAQQIGAVLRIATPPDIAGTQIDLSLALPGAARAATVPAGSESRA